MSAIAFVLVSAGIIGLAGAALGVRDLERKASSMTTPWPELPTTRCWNEPANEPNER